MDGHSCSEALSHLNGKPCAIPEASSDKLPYHGYRSLTIDIQNFIVLMSTRIVPSNSWLASIQKPSI
jgi:hypothetical protein